MQEDLKRLGVKNAIDLPDRAMPAVFNPQNRDNMDVCFDLFTKYKDTFNVKQLLTPELLKNPDIVEERSKNSYVKFNWNKERPMMLLSSTSWTPDEDFDLLLNAVIRSEKGILEMVKGKVKDESLAGKVQLIITGRGPMKERFMQRVAEAKLKIFEVKSIWLESDDYPKLLSVVDLGICLHYSSSGFDLPMKVVDMFSAGLPVLAVEYPTIKELVSNNKNGLLFKSEEELRILLEDHVVKFILKGECKEIEEMRKYILNDFKGQNWIDQW
eukprot:CAMPEP_0170520672 /NCGR_PEP_ID=MMETSP0209-20121228/6006_1 /TAXON_ID=665100 ORGANISM="Litonotus pictus, Strain P1" /NCGR_SAMPLE_ID=MMETSP0209 /ASSEMBLY_ACC=CAM_ASM_000301 /LENGTH=269 /DNA_ID=CAMNT_0010807139 /DNA_START=530 /DNA_END=1336 /DNA_ORIENTATION=-